MVRKFATTSLLTLGKVPGKSEELKPGAHVGFVIVELRSHIGKEAREGG